MFKNKFIAPINILLATLAFVLYIVFVAYPFLVTNQPPNEASSTWAYDYAPVHYALIYFPAYILYLIVICKNIISVKKIRWFIYPIIFIILFVATHMVFFVFSMIILWFCIITVPAGFCGFVATECFAIWLDIYDFKGMTTDSAKTQKLLDKIACNIIPICLLILLLLTFMGVHKKQQLNIEKATICNSKAEFFQTLTNNMQTDTDTNTDSIQEISGKIKSELDNNKELYASLINKNYDSILIWDNSKDKYRKDDFTGVDIKKNNTRIDGFNFYRKGDCSISGNCYFVSNGCRFLINNKGELYQP